MADTTVAIKVLYQDLESARKEAQNLKADLDRLKTERIDLDINATNFSRTMHDIEGQIVSVQRHLAEVRDTMHNVTDPDEMRQYQQEIRNANEEIQRLRVSLNETGIQSKQNSDEIKRNSIDVKNAMRDEQTAVENLKAAEHAKDLQEQMAIERFLADQDQKKKELEHEREIREANSRAYNAMWEEEARAAEAAAQRQQDAFESFNRELEQTGQMVERISGLFTALGSVSGLTADFADSIGNAFGAMSGIFSTDIGQYATASLTHQLMQRLVGNTSNVISRYDILNTFVPYMALAGVDAATATYAQNRINESILGLPIGLDEATQRLRRFQMYTNDIDRATNLTIGVQNAIAAGGSSQSYQTQAYSMIERLLATGDLTNIRQWQSLLVGLGVSQRFIAEELGIPQGDLMSAIREHDIGAEEFLGALERLGSGTTKAAQELQEALNIYKGTIESWVSNIEFAVTRGNANILKALDETLANIYPESGGITGVLETWRNTENDIFSYGANYIRNNPEQLKSIIDAGKSLLDVLAQLSVSDFLEHTVDYIGQLASFIREIVSQFPEGWLEQFSAFAITMSGTVSKIFNAAGGAPVIMGVFDRFKDFDWDLFAKDLADAAKSMASMVSHILNLLKDPLMSKLLAYGLVWGRPVQSILNGIGSGIQSGFNTYRDIALLRYMGVGSGSRGGFLDRRTMAAYEGATPFTYRLGLIGDAVMTALPYIEIAGAGAAVVGGAAAIGTAMQRRTDRIVERDANDITWEEAYQGYIDARAQLEAHEGRDYDAQQRMQYYLAIMDTLRERGYAPSIAGEGKNSKEISARRAAEVQRSSAENAAQFEWLETAGKYETRYDEIYASVVASQALAKSLYEAAQAYQTLYDSARTSIEGQLSLWKELDLNDVHTVAEGTGNSKSVMESNTQVVERYAEAVNFLSDYVEAHPETAGYIGQMVGTMDIADLATIENLVAYIEAGKELPIDSWNALEQAIDRATEALVRWKQVNSETEYTHDEAKSVIQQIFGDDPDVLLRFDELWGDLDKTTESGMKVFKETLYKWLVETGKITQEEVDKINAALKDIGVDPSYLYGTTSDMMDAIRRGLIDVGDKAVWEARRIAYNILHAFDGLTYEIDRNVAERLDYIANGGYNYYSGYATGGLVYASNGKLIPFIPRGTDTVPAMLTPGEFVMRRQAVDTFGSDFMSYINNLNIGAAFDKLIRTDIRSPRSGIVNTYNTRDNHASVNMSIVNGGQGYTLRRASRFVNSL